MSNPWNAPRILSQLSWLLASTGAWVYANNHFIFHWASSPLKMAAELLLAAALFGIAHFAIHRTERTLRFGIPLALIGIFGGGEVHRAHLRSLYHASISQTAPPPDPSWLNPVTTTRLMVTRRTLYVHQGIEPLRVAQLSDLHLTTALPWHYYATVVERLNAEHPDLVVLTGDFVSKLDMLPLLRQWLRLPLQSRLGTFAVLGNHDYWAGAPEAVRRSLEDAGVTMLSGRCQQVSPTQAIHTAAHQVVLCGTESPWGPDFTRARTTPDELVIALSHTPDNIYALRGRADAVFAGHTHGGQLRLPGVGALTVPSIYGRRFDQGEFTVEGTELFVSRGVGADFPPVRIYCEPEILVVDFVARTSNRESPPSR
jgi:predicted MPP superfamily phosphohydrolase